MSKNKSYIEYKNQIERRANKETVVLAFGLTRGFDNVIISDELIESMSRDGLLVAELRRNSGRFTEEHLDYLYDVWGILAHPRAIGVDADGRVVMSDGSVSDEQASEGMKRHYNRRNEQ
jgi:hypothetical protein